MRIHSVLILASVLICTSASGDSRLRTQACRPDSDVFPFQSIEIKYLVTGGGSQALADDFVDVTLRYAKRANAEGGVKEETFEDVELDMGSSSTAMVLHIEHDEWALTNMSLISDRHGVRAFVEFARDGTTKIHAFYECEEFPFNEI